MTFDPEGGNTVNSVTQDYNTQVAEPAAPAKIGHTFGGWYDGDNGIGNAVTFPYTLTADKTVYAKWTVNTYTATYRNNYDNLDITVYITQNAIFDSKLAVPTQPVRSGYIFGGWYIDNVNIIEWNFENYTVVGDINLYAKWTSDPIPTYTVTYAENGATSGSVPVDDNAYTPGTTIKVKGNVGSLAKAGCTFSGWDCNWMTYTAGQTFIVPGNNVTLTAVWIPVPATYTVTYNNNNTNGGVYTTQTTIAVGSTLTAPTKPSRIGYSFIGWYKDAACVNVWNFDTDTIKADINLYAKWAANTCV
jgi:uncharacterized repeat protein (TIGR02543 family)